MQYHTCGKFWIFQERENTVTGKREYRYLKVPCGRGSCPQCQLRKKIKLERRLFGVEWGPRVYMWTITTDPKVISAEKALKTIQKRWNNVNRSAHRLVPGFRYFKVIELTKKGFPHIHFLTNQYIDWDRIREILIQNQFGQVVHFKEVPTGNAVKYVIKYIAKHISADYYKGDMPARIWTASRGLLPELSTGDGQGVWDLIFISSDEGFIEDMFLDAIEGTSQERGPPEDARGDPFQW